MKFIGTALVIVLLVSQCTASWVLAGSPVSTDPESFKFGGKREISAKSNWENQEKRRSASYRRTK